MKTLKLLSPALLIALFAFSNSARAQTYQLDLYTEFEDAYIFCLERKMSGEFLAHFTYHVDKKTGYINRVHCNVKRAEMWDPETGETYHCIDTENDNLGATWDFWDNLNAYNEEFGFYYPDYEDGSLPFPEVYPDEGTAMYASFKFIGPKGKKFTYTFMTQIHRNAHGEITAYVDKSYADCDW
jgi:hypothetical protein